MSDVDKAKAAICRKVSGCTSREFYTCSYCERFRVLNLFNDEFKIVKDKVFVKHCVVERARKVF